jgi:hypothetical protein
MSIEACGYKNPGRSEIIDYWARDFLDCSAHDVTGSSRRKWNVDCVAQSIRTAYLASCSGSWEQPSLVRRDVQDIGVVPKDRLSPVPVMDVPIDDEHALSDIGESSSSDCDVVEEAEPERAIAQGVMARGASGDERHPVRLVSQFLDRRQAGSCGLAGRVPRFGSGVSVGVKISAAALAEHLQLVEIARCMHPAELCPIRGKCGHDVKIGAQAQVLDAGHGGGNSFRSFGMADSVVTELTGRLADDQQDVTPVG